MRTTSRFLALVLCVAGSLAAQTATNRLTVDRIFGTGEFRSASLPTIRWSRDGVSYYDTRTDSTGTAIVRIDVATGSATVIIDAATMVDEAKRPIEVEDFALSVDETRLLVYHKSVQVWRQNTKGIYHLVDIPSKRVVPISQKPGLQMFAKLSPDGRMVAFVRDNNIFVTDLTNLEERAVTTDGGDVFVNGTSDWVYEEEFDLRDGFRWSPDGKRIAFWRFDQSPVPVMLMVNETETQYPRVWRFRYPKAGYPNSLARLGVVDVSNGETQWIDIGNDSLAYIPRMEWAGNDSVAFLRMPRKQNSVDYMMASARTGRSRRMMSDSDSAYIDVQDPVWIKKGKEFLWLSDRTGYRQVFLYDRRGTMIRQITPEGADALAIMGVDEEGEAVFVEMAAPEPTQRQIFRYAFDGSGRQITDAPGSHDITVSPTGKYAIDTYSSLNAPPMVIVYELPSMKQLRVIEENAVLRDKIAGLGLRKAEFIQVPSADGITLLDGYRIVPPDFDSSKKYPVLMYVYGGPANPAAADQWYNTRYLWSQMLAQEGYVVVCVDNRGASWRGREFRKMTQLHLGIIESDDQIAVAKWIGHQSWGDPKRIGIWGWSYGGYMTLMATGRGGDLFKMGMSVAPVTDWREYDTIYTERYMWVPQENKDGYDKSAAQAYVDGITARLLLVHGTGDDNVHPQNTTQISQKMQVARKPFYMMLYPNKTHSISGVGGTLHLYETLTRFIRENL
jgi:dipeptidyl-peptidase 4